MRKTIALSLAAAAAVALGGVAYAQAAPDAAPRGELTRAVVEQRVAKAFGRMDANDDGLLNHADREARQKAVFDRIDADHNGAISLAEFNTMRDDRREARGERPDQRAERGGPRGPGRPGMMLRAMRGPGMARAADADRDGAVSQAEFTGAALARFDRADADKDGKISRDERRALRGPMMRGPMGGPMRGPPPAPDAG